MVVHVIFSLTIGGTELMLIDIVNRQSCFANVTLIIFNEEYLSSLIDKIDNKVKVICIGRKVGSLNPFPFFKLNRILSKLKPDIIHCHNHNMINSLFKRFRNKTVLTVHTTGIDVSNLAKYKECFSISGAVKDVVLKKCNVMAPIVYNGIYLDAIRPRSYMKRTDLFRIVQVGRLSHEVKGQDIALKAARYLIDLGIDNFELHFIGDGPSRYYLERLANDLGLAGYVNFLGAKERLFIYNELASYDIFLQPSLYEGFGLSIVEAMAAKVPVLVSNIEGPMEIINNGEYGYFFETGDSLDLSQKLIDIFDEYTSGKLITKTDFAFNWCVEKFDVNNTATQYLAMYQNVIAE